MQAYENKPYHMLNKTIDDEPVCVCVTNDKILPFLIITCDIQFLTKIRGIP
jgi:hypothetical protein